MVSEFPNPGSSEFDQRVQMYMSAYADWVYDELGKLSWGKDLEWDQEESVQQRQMISEVLIDRMRTEVNQALENRRAAGDGPLFECLDRYDQRSSEQLQEQAAVLLADTDLADKALQATAERVEQRVLAFWQISPARSLTGSSSFLNQLLGKFKSYSQEIVEHSTDWSGTHRAGRARCLGL